MLKTFNITLALVAGLSAGWANAAVITFDSDRANGQQQVNSSYQPLLAGYAGDGGALGITINWGATWTSSRAYNGGVTDHTPGAGGTGAVGYDGGSGSISISFSAPVTIPSFYFANYFGGNYTVDFRGFTNVGDTTPVIDVAVNYAQVNGPNAGGYDWLRETGLAGYAIRSFQISGPLYKQLDDITVLAASGSVTAAQSVPEPASFAIVGLALAALLLVRRQQVMQRQPAVARRSNRRASRPISTR